MYRRHDNFLNFSGIEEEDTPISDIPKFERLNDVSINLFGYENNCVFPLLITNQERERHVNLMLIDGGDHRHYVTITNMSRLLAKQYSMRNNQIYYCPRCLNGFKTQVILNNHTRLCKIHEPANIKLPTESNKILTFTHHERQLKCPFVIYADFECLQAVYDSVENAPNKSWTKYG